MVRANLKGGVWKNSEDEILKAAVQKYGKQMWARVASLLNRKTAKQAKARWHEWLDPAIKKTEWSRAEEEKLLHLAKLMPAQWKTVAPLVGRTATQCQEHYEYLLDQAATEGDASASDQLRKQSAETLRPGQIDSHPETKPARPDPIDMDEDEMEMLQEARARLANTVGKKAKRKQRERMLAQAKRLADLQKRRELKQAGLLSKAASKKSKRKRDIDLGVEIPFHKPAPAGFHDTTSEAVKAENIRQKRLQDVDYHKVNEHQNAARDRGAAQAKKRAETRLRFLESSNNQYSEQKEKEVAPVRRRGTLDLPAPTVSDADWQQMAKLQKEQDISMQLQGGGNGVTDVLLGDYSDRPLPTPMRTVAIASGKTQMSLMREASELRMLERGQTPLLVGQQEDNGDDDAMDLKVAAAATPRPLDRAASSQTPLTLAPRDQLGLNRPHSELRGSSDAASIGASTFASTKYSVRDLARQERRAAKKARLELEAALAALPAPQFEYELAIPEDKVNEESALVETVQDHDQADIESARLELHRKEVEARLAKRSSVIKRDDLPRPGKIVPAAVLAVDANKQILQEMLLLLQHDAFTHPIVLQGASDGSKKKKKRKQAEVITDEVPEVVLEQIPDAAMAKARSCIKEETDTVVNEKVALSMKDGKCPSVEEATGFLVSQNVQSSTSSAGTIVLIDESWHQAVTPELVVDSLKMEFKVLKDAAASLAKKNDKLEAKLGVVTAGYGKRSGKLNEEILTAYSEAENAKIEESVYQMLKKHEELGGQHRVTSLRAEISSLRGVQAAMQKKYGELMIEKRRMRVMAQKTMSLE